MSWYEELDQKMADYLPDVPVLREEPLSRPSPKAASSWCCS